MLAGSLDTNILVRLIAQDDARQALAVDRLLSQHALRGELLFVAVTVVLELEWVMRSRYRRSKAEIIQLFGALLSTVELCFEAEDAVEQALIEYETGGADFGEYLHLALSRKHIALPFMTFDQKAAKAKGAEILNW
jgi:predicted nucleic-acid-binding protein